MSLRLLLLVGSLLFWSSLVVTRLVFDFRNNFMLFFLNWFGLFFGLMMSLFCGLFMLFLVLGLVMFLLVSLCLSFVLRPMVRLDFFVLFVLFMLFVLSLFFMLLGGLLLLGLFFGVSLWLFGPGFPVGPVSIRVFGALAELPRDVSDCEPVLMVVFLLSAHLDEEASGEDLLVEFVFDEVDGIDFGFEDHFEGAGVVLLDLDELEFREGPFNILLDCVKVALDQVEGDVLDLIVKVLYVVDQVLLLRDHELPLLLLSPFHLNNQI